MGVAFAQWERHDAGVVVAELNLNASDFSGEDFSFDGWHVKDASFVPPDVPADEPIAFGRVSPGAPVQVFDKVTGDELDAPYREGTMLLEFFTSSSSDRIWPIINTAAATALATMDVSKGLNVNSKSWRSPSGSDVPGLKITNFDARIASVTYHSSTP